MNFLAVFLGGGIGAILRYALTILSIRYFSFSIYGTFVANIFGCFLIGYVWGIAFYKTDLINPIIKTFLTIGFLGGLTTFSTFSIEAFGFLKDGKIVLSFAYIFVSMISALFATYLGFLCSKQI